MDIGLVTVFPAMFDAMHYGVCARAIDNGLVTLSFWNPREFANDRHRTVDDRPYGGGPGMVMMVDPLRRAIGAARASLGDSSRVIYLSPQGRPISQDRVASLAAGDPVVLVCGRYEGIDERLIALEVDEELSMGDFVVSGGELPAMALIDAMTRLQPGALGHCSSAVEDSFVDDLLDCPHFTRPETVSGLIVPDVLLSGHHERISRWRHKQSLGRTHERRPDLLAKRGVTAEEQRLLDEYLAEH
ncbi:MAG: tRNA (guanosine(37)-N1)-methyltransferase TrmD [Chromatiales bacterium]|jgi:tRNA (guanine37-N1)-methyltransferase|nr:tRNA (guanosine(37)-N1)-methyltransferase TrmD [Chromatiales bacterium]